MTKISDEQLAELVSNFERRATAEWLAEHPEHKQECLELGAALRELQERRKADLPQVERLAPHTVTIPAGDILSTCPECGAFRGHDHVCL